MKKSLLLIAVLGGVFCSFAQETQRCGTMQAEVEKIAADPEYAKMRMKEDARFEQAVKGFAKAHPDLREGNGTSSSTPLYIIPVVYHVVWNTATTNITNAKVLVMHQQLNEDWARLNADTSNTPGPFDSVACDMQIQFCLATIDPSGNPTSGIVRKQTTVASWSTSGPSIKNSAQGGDSPWNVNNYFNIWIGNLGGGLLGWGSFPPISSSYGVVVHYCTVGSLTVAGTCPPFQKGRTLTHEIGHCFNLFHLWSDSCNSMGDYVSDTPNQLGATSGCPSGFPQFGTCGVGPDGSPASNVYPGRMFMNYMDYTDDACMNMFTCGQAARAQTAVTTYLMSLVNAGWSSCGTVGMAENDLESSISIFPNPSNGHLTLTLSKGEGIAEIYNMLGEKVFSSPITIMNNSMPINLSEAANGMYLFRIVTRDGAVTRKIILEK